MKKIMVFLSVMIGLFLTGCVTDRQENIDVSKIEITFAVGDDKDHVTANFELIAKLDGHDVSWESNHKAIQIVDNQAIVTRQESDQAVVLKANVLEETKVFNLIVLKKVVAIDLSQLNLTFAVGDDKDHVTTSFELIAKLDGHDVSWESNHEAIQIVGNQAIVTRQESDQAVVLKANVLEEKVFNLIVLKKVVAIDLSQLNLTFAVGDDKDHVTTSFELIAKLDGHDVSWESNHEAIQIVGNQAIVTRQESDQVVTLVATVLDQEKVFELVVSKKEPKVAKTYLETFETLQQEKDNGNNSSEYLDYLFVGDTPVEWDIVRGRIDLFYKGTNAFTFKGVGGMYAYMEEGLTYLSFDVVLPYPDTDKHTQISVTINGVVIYKEPVQGKKEQTIVIDQLDIRGYYELAIEVSSGHRITVDNVQWITNIKEADDQEHLIIDFEETAFDYDAYESLHSINGYDFMMKEVHTNIMHPENEVPFLTEQYGEVIARFRGLGGKGIDNTPIAYMYNKDAFDHVSKITFDAKYFSSYNAAAKLTIYYLENNEWVLLENVEIGLELQSYTVNVNKDDVIIKIQVEDGSINLDNITYVF